MPYAAWHSCLSNNPSPSEYSNWGNFTDIPNSMTLLQVLEWDPSIFPSVRRPDEDGLTISRSFDDYEFLCIVHR
eukprot:COSAG05_NODE_3121_length_2308_cov_2.488909_1_plen_74_part_00